MESGQIFFFIWSSALFILVAEFCYKYLVNKAYEDFDFELDDYMWLILIFLRIITYYLITGNLYNNYYKYGSQYENLFYIIIFSLAFLGSSSFGFSFYRFNDENTEKIKTLITYLFYAYLFGQMIFIISNFLDISVIGLFIKSFKLDYSLVGLSVYTPFILETIGIIIYVKNSSFLSDLITLGVGTVLFFLITIFTLFFVGHYFNLWIYLNIIHLIGIVVGYFTSIYYLNNRNPFNIDNHIK